MEINALLKWQEEVNNILRLPNSWSSFYLVYSGSSKWTIKVQIDTTFDSVHYIYLHELISENMKFNDNYSSITKKIINETRGLAKILEEELNPLINDLKSHPDFNEIHIAYSGQWWCFGNGSCINTDDYNTLKQMMVELIKMVKNKR